MVTEVTANGGNRVNVVFSVYCYNGHGDSG